MGDCDPLSIKTKVRLLTKYRTDGVSSKATFAVWPTMFIGIQALRKEFLNLLTGPDTSQVIKSMN